MHIREILGPVFLGMTLLAATSGSAQSPTPPLINVGLFPTAALDSFEVRIFADAALAQPQGVLNGVFTIRWEAASGGTVKTSTMGSDCSAYLLVANGEPVITNGASNYFTFNINGVTADLGTECPIGTTGAPIGGFKMEGFTSCAQVNVVNDTYTGNNNKDLYISVGGVDRTGNIYSTPVIAGFPGDLDANGVVDVQDFLIFNGAFGSTCSGCVADINGSGVVDVQDFLIFNGAFGTTCP